MGRELVGSELVGSELVGSELARVLWLPVEPIDTEAAMLLFVRTLVGDGTPGTLRSFGNRNPVGL